MRPAELVSNTIDLFLEDHLVVAETHELLLELLLLAHASLLVEERRLLGPFLIHLVELFLTFAELLLLVLDLFLQRGAGVLALFDVEDDVLHVDDSILALSVKGAGAEVEISEGNESLGEFHEEPPGVDIRKTIAFRR